MTDLITTASVPTDLRIRPRLSAEEQLTASLTKSIRKQLDTGGGGWEYYKSNHSRIAVLRYNSNCITTDPEIQYKAYVRIDSWHIDKHFSPGWIKHPFNLIDKLLLRRTVAFEVGSFESKLSWIKSKELYKAAFNLMTKFEDNNRSEQEDRNEYFEQAKADEALKIACEL